MRRASKIHSSFISLTKPFVDLSRNSRRRPFLDIGRTAGCLDMSGGYLIDLRHSGFAVRSIANAFHDLTPEPAGKTARTAGHSARKFYPQSVDMYSPLCHFG
jgi:hypothetical protein